MTDKFIFGCLAALLFLLPLPFGSVEEWSVFVFQTLILLLAAAYLLSLRTGSQSSGAQSEAEPGRAGIPVWVKILFGVFFVVSVLQCVPLPLGWLSFLAPLKWRIVQDVTREGLMDLASNHWQALSFVPWLTVTELLRYISYSLFAWLLFRTMKSRKQAQGLFVVLILAGVFQAGYGLAEYLGGTHTIFGYKNVHSQWSAAGAFGTFINRNHFAGYLEMTFSLCVGLLAAKLGSGRSGTGLSFTQKLVAFSQKKLAPLLLLGSAAALMGLGIAYSRSRAGILVFILILAVGCAGIFQKRHAALSWIIPLVLVLVLGLVALAGRGPVLERFVREKLPLDVGRPLHYKDVLILIGQAPLAGTGAGTFLYASFLNWKIDTSGPSTSVLHHAHNDYLEVWAESGLIAGTSLILCGLALFVILFLRRRRRRDPVIRGLALGCLLGLAALLLHSSLDFNLRIPANALTFLALYAVGLKTVRLERDGGRTVESPAVSSSLEGPRLRIKKLSGALGIGLLLFFSTCLFLGWYHLHGAQTLRNRTADSTSDFRRIEQGLLRALRFNQDPVIYRELASVYLERALIDAGKGRRRESDAFCDRAQSALREQLRRNPFDPMAYFEMGKVYLLYNYPLLTYQSKAKRYFRKALDLADANSFLNQNILYIYLTQWDFLSTEERRFVRERLDRINKKTHEFMLRLRSQWKDNFGNLDRLEEILSSPRE